MGERRRARECALQCLYQWDMTAATADSILACYWEAHPAPAAVREFAERLVRGTLAGIHRIDLLIGEQAEHWRFDRMGRVERNILRLGVHELLSERQTPAAVVIDEAIELAKRYSGPQAGQFVNGVLDGVNERLDGDRTKADSEAPGIDRAADRSS